MRCKVVHSGQAGSMLLVVQHWCHLVYCVLHPVCFVALRICCNSFDCADVHVPGGASCELHQTALSAAACACSCIWSAGMSRILDPMLCWRADTKLGQTVRGLVGSTCDLAACLAYLHLPAGMPVLHHAQPAGNQHRSPADHVAGMLLGGALRIGCDVTLGHGCVLWVA
jgi:hypothetical protein